MSAMHTHHYPTDLCLALETLTLRGNHQAQEMTQQSHLLVHSSVFHRDLSPMWGESCESPQTRGGFTLGLEEKFACGAAFPV